MKDYICPKCGLRAKTLNILGTTLKDAGQVVYRIRLPGAGINGRAHAINLMSERENRSVRKLLSRLCAPSPCRYTDPVFRAEWRSLLRCFSLRRSLACRFVDGLKFLRVLLIRAVKLLQAFVIARQRPTTRRRVPGFREHLGVLDGDLVDEVIQRRTADVLDHMLLVAMKKLAASEIMAPLIETDDVDDQRISPPMTHGVASEPVIGISLMRTSIGGYDAKIIAEFVELH